MRLAFSTILIFLVIFAEGQSVAINTDGSLPASSALLEVKSVTKGMLIPRMTSSQRTAIPSPSTGLMVFDMTTLSVWFYSGAIWIELRGVGNSNYWLPHSNGMYYTAGKIGIGMTPHAIVPLTVWQPNSNAGNAILHLRSNDVFHSAVTLFNGNIGSETHYSLILAGPSNVNQAPGGFGLLNHQTMTWTFNASPGTNYLAIGSPSFNAQVAKSRLHVFSGDVNIDQIGSGIIMKSPNGSCWRVTIDDTGNFVRTAITCP